MTTSSIRSCSYLLFVALATIGTAVAQPPRAATVSLLLASPIPDDGPHSIHVRWYTSPIGGRPIWQESLVAEVNSGRLALHLGSIDPLPDTVVRSSRVYLGISIDGEAERVPREEILPFIHALRSNYADMAARLDPNATGIVTSINELSGPITIAGENGVDIRRVGSRFIVSRAQTAREQGVIRGDGTSFRFRIQTSAAVQHPSNVTFYVTSPSTTLTATVRIEAPGNALVFDVSAPLLADEAIIWMIHD
jgi:hypothetical protein